jgi:dynein heavy chain 2
MEAFGLNSLAGVTYSFKSIHAESTEEIPILFIVSAGYDPSKELEEFCNAQVGKENYKQLSMGGGQNEEALRILKEAADHGYWVCFKNLHLVTSWLPNLEKEFKALKKHSNFRLFLTTEQHIKFPSILLETCFKVCYEAPPGIKKNLIRIYQSWQPTTNPLKNTLMFLLAFFHSIVQERRTYIPQGWSKAYEFSYSDLKVAEQIIDNLVAESETTKSFNFLSLYGIFE